MASQLKDMTVPARGLADHTSDIMADQSRSPVILLDIPAQSAVELTLGFVATVLARHDGRGVYVTTTKSFDELAKLMASSRIVESKINVVDCISEMYGLVPDATDPAMQERCIMVSGPINLDGILAAVEEQLGRMEQGVKDTGEGMRFVLLDSITTLLLYNSLPVAAQFVTKLATLLKKRNVTCVVISLSKGATSTKLLEALSSHIDEIVRVKP